jgi:hypothetical protein
VATFSGLQRSEEQGPLSSVTSPLQAQRTATVSLRGLQSAACVPKTVPLTRKFDFGAFRQRNFRGERMHAFMLSRSIGHV